MARPLRKSFVVTASALVATACAPPRTRKVSGEPTSGWEGKQASVDFAHLKALNPRDGEQRTIYAAREKCYVIVPSTEPQTSVRDGNPPPPSTESPCPK